MIQLVETESVFDAIGDIDARGLYYGKSVLGSGKLLGKERGFIKYKDKTICEVVGFEVARRLGVRVANYVGWWTKEGSWDGPVNEGIPYGVGIVCDFLPDLREINLFTANNMAERDTDFLTSFLVSSLFLRDEPSGLGESQGKLYGFDFETMFALCMPQIIMNDGGEEHLEKHLRIFENGLSGLYEFMQSYARKLDLSDEFRKRIHALAVTNVDERRKWTYIRNHPLADLLTAYFTAQVTIVVNLLRQERKLLPQSVVDWRRLAKRRP